MVLSQTATVILMVGVLVILGSLYILRRRVRLGKRVGKF